MIKDKNKYEKVKIDYETFLFYTLIESENKDLYDILDLIYSRLLTRLKKYTYFQEIDQQKTPMIYIIAPYGAMKLYITLIYQKVIQQQSALREIYLEKINKYLNTNYIICQLDILKNGSVN